MHSVFSFRGVDIRKFCTIEYVLPVFWVLGLFAGQYAAITNSSVISDILVLSVNERGSFFVGILIPSIWLYITYLLLCRKPSLILLVVFAKACLLGLAGAGCSIAFGCAGWLVRILLMFSNFVHSVIFLIFCYCGLHWKPALLRKRLLLFLISIVVVEFVDYFLISDFLISLF